MNNVPLQMIPNQSFSVTLDDDRYDIRIVESNGTMSVSIARNTIPIIVGVRATAGTLLLPYLYEEKGNFLFFNINDELIYYTNFSKTQSLSYLSAGDLAYLRGP